MVGLETGACLEPSGILSGHEDSITIAILALHIQIREQTMHVTRAPPNPRAARYAIHGAIAQDRERQRRIGLRSLGEG